MQYPFLSARLLCNSLPRFRMPLMPATPCKAICKTALFLLFRSTQTELTKAIHLVNRHICQQVSFKKMKKYILALSVVMGFIVLISYSCSKPQPVPASDQNQYLSAGYQTVFDASSTGYNQDFPVLSADKQKLHDIGDIAFEGTYVAPPA